MKGVTIVEVINYSGTFGIVGEERETGVSRKYLYLSVKLK